METSTVGAIRLGPAGPAGLDAYLARSIPAHAREKVAARQWSGAESRARLRDRE